MSAGKVLASVFWYTHGILYVNYLEKGKPMNSINYMALLVRLKGEIAKKRPQMRKNEVLFHQDNAREIAFSSTVSSGSGFQQLLSVFRPKKYAPGKEISFQWKTNC